MVSSVILVGNDILLKPMNVMHKIRRLLLNICTFKIIQTNKKQRNTAVPMQLTYNRTKTNTVIRKRNTRKKNIVSAVTGMKYAMNLSCSSLLLQSADGKTLRLYIIQNIPIYKKIAGNLILCWLCNIFFLGWPAYTGYKVRPRVYVSCKNGLGLMAMLC